MNPTMPEFKSRSIISTWLSGMRDIATAVFKAIVLVPAPAFDGRKQKTLSENSILAGFLSSNSANRAIVDW
jgi:hypothetical protein